MREAIDNIRNAKTSYHGATEASGLLLPIVDYFQAIAVALFELNRDHDPDRRLNHPLSALAAIEDPFSADGVRDYLGAVRAGAAVCVSTRQAYAVNRRGPRPPVAAGTFRMCRDRHEWSEHEKELWSLHTTLGAALNLIPEMAAAVDTITEPPAPAAAAPAPAAANLDTAVQALGRMLRNYASLKPTDWEKMPLQAIEMREYVDALPATVREVIMARKMKRTGETFSVRFGLLLGGRTCHQALAAGAFQALMEV